MCGVCVCVEGMDEIMKESERTKDYCIVIWELWVALKKNPL